MMVQQEVAKAGRLQEGELLRSEVTTTSVVPVLQDAPSTKSEASESIKPEESDEEPQIYELYQGDWITLDRGQKFHYQVMQRFQRISRSRFHDSQ